MGGGETFCSSPSEFLEGMVGDGAMTESGGAARVGVRFR